MDDAFSGRHPHRHTGIEYAYRGHTVKTAWGTEWFATISRNGETVVRVQREHDGSDVHLELQRYIDDLLTM